MGAIHGVRSIKGLRERASSIEIGGMPLRVAALDGIIRSKRAAKRPRDRAVLEILEKTREEAGTTRGRAINGPPRE